MDIQKDKDFTSLPEIAKLYQACKERDLTIAEREYLKGARDAWQAAKTQAVPEWISVEDKLPTENGNYLVCIDGDVFYLTAKWVKNHFKFLARGYGLTEDFTDWRYCEGVKVTHWMTLPAAPQEPTND